MKIAVIPARGGSKRIPRKNIKLFAGKPLIAYAIQIARESGLFDRIIVSTEDEEISSIALHYGAEVPFVRPLNLADDFTTTLDVVRHAIDACTSLGWVFEDVCCLYPGVPFSKVGDLLNAYDILNTRQVAFSFPVTEFPSAIQRALKRNANGQLIPLSPEHEKSRTQDLEKAYFDAGQFYWGSKSSWISNDHIHKNAVGFLIPNWRVVDIDTPEDWRRAEIMYKVLNSN